MDDNDLGDIGYDPYEFANVIGDGDQPLYPGCSALLWTINDFPAYGNLSGYVVKGYKACPICGDDTPSHRHVLGVMHIEKRHVLDVMHIEKNVCDSIIDTLLEIPGKNKDGIAAPLDLLNMGVKTDLQPEYGERRTRLPLRPWNLSKAEKRAICNSFYGCIVERYISEEAVEFCTEHLSDVSTVGVPSSQKMGVSKPLSCCTNKEEVLPYIEEHMIHIKATYPKFRKRTKWLQDKHNSTFIQWLHFKSTKLGFTLVDLSKIGHKNDQFVMASQVKQVFYVDYPMHRGWSVVISMPNREYNDVIGDNVLGDIRIECEPFTRGIPNVDTFDGLVGEFGSENIRDGCEDIWID
ncbi:hypothetical protein L3X38_032349 [Prunus dulcis]|uniref:DUF4216 domain-containing protein n=1 Tax=Prunus dulcis TaxID=3755 RepID=A0AAD4VFL0_PRUDU|nr:hypothetical protein L3X38_032349 [Prunus dulcis]